MTDTRTVDELERTAKHGEYGNMSVGGSQNDAITALADRCRELERELHDTVMRDERHWKERNEARARLDAYTQFVYCAGPTDTYAVERTDEPVLIPKPESIRLIIDRCKAAEQRIAELERERDQWKSDYQRATRPTLKNEDWP